MEFCEFDGNILNEDGRCPNTECVHNLIIDALADVDESQHE